MRGGGYNNQNPRWTQIPCIPVCLHTMFGSENYVVFPRSCRFFTWGAPPRQSENHWLKSAHPIICCCGVVLFPLLFLFPRFLLGLLNAMVSASKTLVSEVCGKEHETVGMGVVTSESFWDSVSLVYGYASCVPPQEIRNRCNCTAYVHSVARSLGAMFRLSTLR